MGPIYLENLSCTLNEQHAFLNELTKWLLIQYSRKKNYFGIPMNIIPVALAIVTFFSTLLGGFLVLRYRKCLTYIFAFAAGSILTVAFMEILPQSLLIAGMNGILIRDIMAYASLSFLVCLIMEKYFSTHPLIGIASESHIMGPIGAGSLILMSFLDGLSMGVAFQTSVSIGILVAIAIIIHDIPDGINTVVLILKSNREKNEAVHFLLMDGLSPLAGVLLTSFIIFPQSLLAILLAIFAGEFIYVAAASLLPENPYLSTRKILVSVLLGFIFIFVIGLFL
jgi:zinc transporter ZupT